MRHEVRVRFWLEAAMASLSAFLLALTFVSREWIEAIFGVDPDHGSGSLEWLIVGALVLVTIALGVIARAEWRRLAFSG